MTTDIAGGNKVDFRPPQCPLVRGMAEIEAELRANIPLAERAIFPTIRERIIRHKVVASVMEITIPDPPMRVQLPPRQYLQRSLKITHAAQDLIGAYWRETHGITPETAGMVFVLQENYGNVIAATMSCLFDNETSSAHIRFATERDIGYTQIEQVTHYMLDAAGVYLVEGDRKKQLSRDETDCLASMTMLPGDNLAIMSLGSNISAAQVDLFLR